MNRFSQKKKRRQKIKEVPSFIQNEKTRISRSIKFILMSSKKKKSNCFYVHLKNEILLNSQSKSSVIEIKNSLQKAVVGKKHIFKYYPKK
jgi:ribosomal protein S7